MRGVSRGRYRLEESDEDWRGKATRETQGRKEGETRKWSEEMKDGEDRPNREEEDQEAEAEAEEAEEQQGTAREMLK